MASGGATLPANYSADFRGLLTTLELSLAILGIGVLVHEAVRRVKRDTIYWRAGECRTRPLSSEDLGFGYLYHARQFIVANASPPLPPWPLQWIWQAWSFDDAWYRVHVGLDATVYLRFLRACWFYVVIHLFTTFPTLLTINLKHSGGNLSATDLARASLSSLLLTPDGRSLLWLQVLFLYWLIFTWCTLIIWVGVGALRHRRAHLADVMKCRASAKSGPRDGWRFRSVIVTNIPSDLGLRDKKALVAYFERGLEMAPQGEQEALPLESSSQEKVVATDALVSDVVLVRRSAELQTQSRKRLEALHQLEAAHIALAKNALHAVSDHLRRKTSSNGSPPNENLEKLEAALQPYLDRSVPAHPVSVWEILASLPKDLLDPYQPLYRLRKRFKGQKVAAIDYWTLKVKVLDGAVRALREKEADTAVAASALVTFKTASDARRACLYMPSHPTRLFACKVRPAPDARDLIWEKIVRVSFRSDVLRSVTTHALIWFATLVWVLPVSLFVALISLDNIAQGVPALARYLDTHSTAKAVLTTLVPTLATSIIAFFVPTILNQVTMRAQHLFTVSKLFHRVGFRYYVWLMCNVVILYAVGTTVVQSVFTDPQAIFTPDSVLQRVASAFTAAAPFYVGFQLLILGLQNGFELMLLGYAWIGANATRKAGTPRRRHDCSLPRILNLYWWQPQTLLALAIFQVFALLNSLVICFALPYYTVNLLVLKNQFAHVYFRRHFENNGRTIYTRFLRFSLDSLILTCTVFIAFFFINGQGRYGAAAIVALVFCATFKLTATRWYIAHMDALNVLEADLYTGAPLHSAQDIVTVSVLPVILRKLPIFRKAVIRVPAILLAPADRLNEEPRLPLLSRIRDLSFVTGTAAASKTSLSSTTRTMQAQASFATATTAYIPPQQESAVSAGALAPSDVNAKVMAHPVLVRDDRTDHTASYDDPYYAKPLESYLWLPRDPISPLDLNDTVEYRGRALVSTVGGDGILWQHHEILSPVEPGNVSKGLEMSIGHTATAVGGEKLSENDVLAGQGSHVAPDLLPSSSGIYQNRRSPSTSPRILTGSNIGTKTHSGRSQSIRKRTPSLISRRSASNPASPAGPHSRGSYFPHVAAGSDALGQQDDTAPTAGEGILQEDALQQEVLEEERAEAAERAKEEDELRKKEAIEERKAAERDSKHFFSGVTKGRKSWLRRFANATDP